MLMLSVKTAALRPYRESLALAMTLVPKGVGGNTLVELIRVSKLVGLDLMICYPGDSKKRHVGAECERGDGLTTVWARRPCCINRGTGAEIPQSRNDCEWDLDLWPCLQHR